VGHPIHRDAALAIEKLGGEISNFAARQLTPKIASEGDLILTMTEAHRDTLLELAPRQLHTAFTLDEAARLATEFNPRSLAELSDLRSQLNRHQVSDIPDPMGQSGEFFEMVATRIARLVPPVLKLLESFDRH
jgi:protein-tyrosine phosphatase